MLPFVTTIPANSAGIRLALWKLCLIRGHVEKGAVDTYIQAAFYFQIPNDNPTRTNLVVGCIQELLLGLVADELKD